MTLFTEELRECLDVAGFSDCGENDEWNFWYQRILKAHDDAVERQIATEQAENTKLRELVRDMHHAICCLVVLGDDYAGEHEDELCALDDRMRELGVEV